MARRMRALEYLDQACQSGELVEIQRSVLGARREEGYVVGIGKKWLLIHVLDDGMNLDGYRAVRTRDIARTQPDPRSFHRRALAVRGQRRKVPKGIKLDRTRDALRTASKKYRIVAVHLEYSDPDVCYIGSARITKKYLHLHQITPNAHWRRKSTPLHRATISRIDFGGQYEQALLAVADAARRSPK